MNRTYTIRMTEEERAALEETARLVKRTPAWLIRELISCLGQLDVTSSGVTTKKYAEHK